MGLHHTNPSRRLSILVLFLVASVVAPGSLLSEEPVRGAESEPAAIFSTDDETLRVRYEIDPERTARQCLDGFLPAAGTALAGLTCSSSSDRERTIPVERRFPGRSRIFSSGPSAGPRRNDRGAHVFVSTPDFLSGASACVANLQGTLTITAFVDPRTGRPLAEQAGGIPVARFPAGSMLLPVGAQAEVSAGSGTEGMVTAAAVLGSSSAELFAPGCDGAGCQLSADEPIGIGSTNELQFRLTAAVVGQGGGNALAQLGCRFEAAVPTLDEDGDGVPLGADCDDADPAVAGPVDGECNVDDVDDTADASGGVITLAWDPVPGAAGYRVHWGLESYNYQNTVDVGNSFTVVLNGLAPCTTHYLAATSYDATGESDFIPIRRVDPYSASAGTEVRGWATPVVTDVSPPAVMQGEEGVILTIEGSGFTPDSIVTIENDPLLPDGSWALHVLAASAVGCHQMEILLSVGPNAETEYPAAAGPRDLLVVANSPGGPSGSLTNDAFEVLVRFSRADIDGNRRVDGFDLWELFDAYGSHSDEPEYNPGADIDGDGLINGNDLAYLAMLFGRAF